MTRRITPRRLALRSSCLALFPNQQQKRYLLEELHLPLELATKDAKNWPGWYDGAQSQKSRPLTKEQIEKGKQAQLSYGSVA